MLLARAGGGFGGFGGGGRSFGGGGFRGGGHHFFFFGGGGGGGGVFLVIIALVLVFVVVSWLKREWIAEQRRARRRRRAARVTTASAQAAEDDPLFAADAVVAAATDIFRGVQRAWSTNDHEGLRARVGGDLLEEWDRRLTGFARKGWRNEVSILTGPAIEYVGLVNRPGIEDDRVVVCIRATLRDVVRDRHGRLMTRSDTITDTASMCEYWTLARAGEGWKVVSIEQEAEGDHVLRDEIIAVPDADEARMRDDSLVELAAADAPVGFSPGELAPLEYAGNGRAAALDLSLADPRWAPDVLEVAARRAVSAWAEAVDGPDDALTRVAGPEAVSALLYGGDASRRTRLVVRGPRLLALTVIDIDPRATPPRVEVEARLRGRRYVEDRESAVVISGSPDREREFVERWALVLDGSPESPWRVGVPVASPA